MCVQCTVQIETFIGVGTMQSGSVISVCTVHSVE